MRKIAAVTLIFILLLSGCSSKNRHDEIYINKESLNASFTAESNSVQYGGTSAWDGEKIIFSVSSPQELEGFKFACSGNEICCSFAETDLKYSYSDLPDDFVFYKFSKELRSAEGEVLQKKSDGIYEYECNDAVFTADSRGNLIYFKCKNAVISFTGRQ